MNEKRTVTANLSITGVIDSKYKTLTSFLGNYEITDFDKSDEAIDEVIKILMDFIVFQIDNGDTKEILEKFAKNIIKGE